MNYKISFLILLIIGGIGNISAQKNIGKDKGTKNDSLRTISLPELTVVSTNKPINQKQVISLQDLKIVQAPSLGETLSRIPGIQNSTYGAVSGSPMIRSLSGNRVKVLDNNLTLNDMSGISPDFVILSDLDAINGIEVYKSNAAVLFGGGAIGGAINIKANVIPTYKIQKYFQAKADLRSSSNMGHKFMTDLQGEIGPVTWHIGGNYMRFSGIRIPGNSKAGIVYDKSIIGFDSRLQTLAQVNVKTISAKNITLYPYIYPFSDEYMRENGLTEDDRYTLKPTHFDPNTFTYVPNQANPDYIPNQPKNTPWTIQKVLEVKDYGPTQMGLITNSFGRNSSVHAGITFWGDRWTLGAGYQAIYNFHGLPVYALSKKISHHHHNTNHKAEKPEYKLVNVFGKQHQLSMNSTFTDMCRIFPWIRLNYIGTINKNQELLGFNIASSFDIRHQAIRLELHQEKTALLNGVSGVDYNTRTIKGEGPFRFLPDNKSAELGVFCQQTITYKNLTLQLGYRHEQVKRSATLTNNYTKGRGLAGRDLTQRNYGLNQVNLALTGVFLNSAKVSVSYNHSERAPQVNELYAGNDHFAIATEENGDDRLNKEYSNGIELEASLNLNGWSCMVNLYHTYFANYIYLGDTGMTRDVFAVREWRQAQTAIEGIEGQLGYKVMLGHYGKLGIQGYFDLVKNMNKSENSMRKFSEGDYMPNMPTSRIGLSVDYTLGGFSATASLDRYLKQKYTGKMISQEYAFPAYSLLNARLAYAHKMKTVDFEYYLSGTNLLNMEARPQNSIIKYLAPLPGRNINLGIRIAI